MPTFDPDAQRPTRRRRRRTVVLMGERVGESVPRVAAIKCVCGASFTSHDWETMVDNVPMGWAVAGVHILCPECGEDFTEAVGKELDKLDGECG